MSNEATALLSHVEFRSDAFPAEPDEDTLINPGRFDRRLAKFLVDRLDAAGVANAGWDSEDRGWRIGIYNESFYVFPCVGNYDEYENGFLVFIEPSRPFVGQFPKFWHRSDARPLITRLQKPLDEILRASPDIYNIRWWTDQEFNNAG